MIELLAEPRQCPPAFVTHRIADGPHGRHGLVDIETAAGQHARIVVELSVGQVDQGKHPSILRRRTMRRRPVPILRHGVMNRVIVHMIGMGTIVNVVAVLAGASLGMLLGDRFGARTRVTITDTLGLLTLVIAGTSIVPLAGEPLTAAVGAAGMIVIMVAMLLGTLIGSGLRLEEALAHFGVFLRRRLIRKAVEKTIDEASAEGRFVDGFVTASLVFCIGPLAILGSLNDGLGRGAEQLYLKSGLDFFAAMAFAASLGVGVAASAITVALLQGLLTVIGWLLGDVLPMAQIDALTVAGGVILGGLGLRLLSIKEIRVADMLPGLLVAPIAVWVVELVV